MSLPRIEMRVELIEGCTWISYTSACISEFARKNRFPMRRSANSVRDRLAHRIGFGTT